MKNELIVNDSFIEDVGLKDIRSWLSVNTCCEENINYFNQLRPKFDKKNLTDEFMFSDEILKSLIRKESLFSPKLSDISIPIISLQKKEFILDISDVNEIRNMILYYYNMKKKFKGNHFRNWKKKISLIDDPKNILNEINKVVNDEPDIKKNASKELNKIYKSINATQAALDNKIHSELDKYSKLGFLKENRIVFRAGKMMLAVNSSNKKKVRGIIDGFSSTRQTCFIQPIALVELTNKLSELKSYRDKEILKILKALTLKISLYYKQIDSIYYLTKFYDRHLTKALFAYKINAIEPKFSNSLILKNAINPIFSLANKNYIPLNISLNPNDRTIIVSGPNSGGKTVVIKSIGLYSIMAQCGLHIPASHVELPIFKTFLSDIGDKQSIQDDLSTFSAHMKSIANIIKKSNKNALVIIDEMGTGTDPDIGSSLSISILNKLTQKGSLNLCTTHLNPLKIWANENMKSKNASMEFDSKKIEPTYIFKLDAPGSSYGIEIAERMGIDKDIIKDASQNLNKDSFKMEKLLNQISHNHKKSLDKLRKAEEKTKKILKREKEINKNKQKLEQEMNEFQDTILTDSNSLLMSYRKNIESIIEEIRINKADTKSIKKAKEYISESLDNINSKIKKNKPIISNDFLIGEKVYLRKFETSATILEIDQKTKKIKVDVNNKKVTINIEDVNKYESDDKNRDKDVIGKHNIEPLETLRIDIRGKRAHEAIPEIDKFLDKALLGNYKNIDILHGKGTGALQKAIHEHLRTLKFINKFNFAPTNQGGTGITIVEFL